MYHENCFPDQEQNIHIYIFSVKRSKGYRLLRNQSEKDNFSVSIEYSKAHQKYENSILLN